MTVDGNSVANDLIMGIVTLGTRACWNPEVVSNGSDQDEEASYLAEQFQEW